MTARFRILITDRAWPDTSIEQDVVSEIDACIIEPDAPGESALMAAAADADAIATTWAHVSAAVIRSSSRCRVISRLGIGIDNIDIETATELGIPVTNCPDYCVDEVSDHALGLLLACARQIGLFHLRAKRGEYNSVTSRPMQRLSGQTLGLLGLGHIARQLVPKARALGLKVIAHSLSGQDHGSGVPMVSFGELLAASDFISLHAPLTPLTSRMFDDSTFTRMKPSAYLINTSRGGLVDQDALYRAILRNQLAGAALDVFSPEPPDLDQPLYRDERVIVTPHVAFVSEQSIRQLRIETMQKIVAALSGQRPQNVLNPQIYSAR
ncbi:MAG: C-terminal binding protein [Planctomycetes bacterium]|nr:C-terminal binding protein [Planctomycetota bacterium]